MVTSVGGCLPEPSGDIGLKRMFINSQFPYKGNVPFLQDRLTVP